MTRTGNLPWGNAIATRDQWRTWFDEHSAYWRERGEWMDAHWLEIISASPWNTSDWTVNAKIWGDAK
jgi:hypothetical protein